MSGARPTIDSKVFSKLLNRILGRTSRDVALATAAVKAVEKVAKWTPPPPEPRSCLDVHLEGGEAVSWTATPSVRGDGTWKAFLRWYHGRPKSRTFVFEHEEGSHMVRRKDIKRYEIRYWTA